jgi:hypothetical protein
VDYNKALYEYHGVTDISEVEVVPVCVIASDIALHYVIKVVDQFKHA